MTKDLYDWLHTALVCYQLDYWYDGLDRPYVESEWLNRLESMTQIIESCVELELSPPRELKELLQAHLRERYEFLHSTLVDSKARNRDNAELKMLSVLFNRTELCFFVEHGC